MTIIFAGRWSSSGVHSERSAREKRQIAENLAEHWGVSADAASEALEQQLTEEEEKKLADLNEFNFDGL